MAPLWEVLKSVVTKEPKTQCTPAIWNFDDVKKLVIEAGDVITAEEAERRVLVLENPALRGRSRVTNSLFAGIQLIMPGEVAPRAPHVSSAIRFVLDGEGAYTAVEGEKAIMSPGDFILTPNWAPHDHGNTSDKPMMWLDVLDMPTVNLLRDVVLPSTSTTRCRTRRAGRRLARASMAPACCRTARRPSNRSPVINYTYARTRPILERMMKSGDIDKRHGARVRYANPLNGGWVMPTMGAHLSLLPKGFKGEPYRSTDGTIFVCVEGKGQTKIGDEMFEWGKNDVFVVPPWKRYATPPTRSRCCSRSPTARCRKRSASGARRRNDQSQGNLTDCASRARPGLFLFGLSPPATEAALPDRVRPAAQTIRLLLTPLPHKPAQWLIVRRRCL